MIKLSALNKSEYYMNFENLMSFLYTDLISIMLATKLAICWMWEEERSMNLQPPYLFINNKGERVMTLEKLQEKKS